VRPFAYENNNTWLKQLNPAVEVFFGASHRDLLGGRPIFNSTATDKIAVCNLIQLQAALPKGIIRLVNWPTRNEAREN
jgi:hypothetical protein